VAASKKGGKRNRSAHLNPRLTPDRKALCNVFQRRIWRIKDALV
jgi:hypothetical protein